MMQFRRHVGFKFQLRRPETVNHIGASGVLITPEVVEMSCNLKIMLQPPSLSPTTGYIILYTFKNMGNTNIIRASFSIFSSPAAPQHTSSPSQPHLQRRHIFDPLSDFLIESRCLPPHRHLHNHQADRHHLAIIRPLGLTIYSSTPQRSIKHPDHRSRPEKRHKSGLTRGRPGPFPHF